MGSSISQNLTVSCQQLVIMDDLNLDEKSLGK